MTNLYALVGALVAVFGAVGAVVLGFSGKARVKAENKELKKRIEASDNARRTQDVVDKMAPDERRRRLDGWMRDDNPDV